LAQAAITAEAEQLYRDWCAVSSLPRGAGQNHFAKAVL